MLDLTSGYIQRAAGQLPQQSTRPPWLSRQNHLLDLAAMRLGRIDDDIMRFDGRRPTNVTAQYSSR